MQTAGFIYKLPAVSPTNKKGAHIDRPENFLGRSGIRAWKLKGRALFGKGYCYFDNLCSIMAIAESCAAGKVQHNGNYVVDRVWPFCHFQRRPRPSMKPALHNAVCGCVCHIPKYTPLYHPAHQACLGCGRSKVARTRFLFSHTVIIKRCIWAKTALRTGNDSEGCFVFNSPACKWKRRPLCLLLIIFITQIDL